MQSSAARVALPVGGRPATSPLIVHTLTLPLPSLDLRRRQAHRAYRHARQSQRRLHPGPALLALPPADNDRHPPDARRWSLGRLPPLCHVSKGCLSLSVSHPYPTDHRIPCKLFARWTLLPPGLQARLPPRHHRRRSVVPLPVLHSIPLLCKLP